MERSACLLFLAVLAGPAAVGQTQVDLRFQSKHVDFSGAMSTRPFRTGALLPPVCETGEMFFLTTAVSGANLFGCVSTNIWLQMGGNPGGSSAFADLKPSLLRDTVTIEPGSFVVGNIPYRLAAAASLKVRSIPITGASNTTPITITAASHALSTGMQVTISGVSGNTAANGTWTITVLNANSFTLAGSTGSGAYTSGGQVDGFGNGTGFLYMSDGGSLIFEYPRTMNLLVTPVRATLAPVDTAGFPHGSIPIAEVIIGNGVWDSLTDRRSLLNSKPILAGTGISLLQSAGLTEVAVDTATIPTLGGSNAFIGEFRANAATMTAPHKLADADPATCNAAVRETYRNRTTNKVRVCVQPNVWADEATTDTSAYPTFAGSNAFTGAMDFSATQMVRNRVVQGVPPASACDSDGEIGSQVTRSDEVPSGESAAYVCQKTGPGTYSWQMLGGAQAAAPAETPHTLLSPMHADTASGTPARGDLIVAAGNPARFTSLPVGADGRILASDGQAPVYRRAMYTEEVWYPIGGSTSSTSFIGQGWHMPNVNAPALILTTGPTRHSVLQYADNGIDRHVVFATRLTSANPLEAVLVISPVNTGSGIMKFVIETKCRNALDDFTDNSSYNTGMTVLSLAEGANTMVSTTPLALNMTGCTAGAMLFMKIGRPTQTDPADTYEGKSVNLYGIALRSKREITLE